MRDKERVLLQEKKNYDRAREIFNELLKGKNPQYQQMPDLSVSDMRMQVATNKYNIELKSRSETIYDYNEMLLKVKKYCNLIKDTKEDETLLYLAIVEGGDWYLWNLSTLDWRKVKLDNIRTKKQEYNINGTYYVEEPYFHLPLDTAILSKSTQKNLVLN